VSVAITTGIAIYFLIWWIVLFAVLPWGVHAQGEEAPPGTDPGAPRIPLLRAKLIWTTAVSTVVYGVCTIVYVYRLVTLDDLARLLGMPH
jgi:predicted secreted protein